MAITAWVVMLPFILWVYVGIAFVIWRTLIAIVTLVVTEELEMEDLTHEYPARLIRYTTVADADHPNLLSIFDSVKNIQMIDRELAAYLPESMRNRLEMSTIPATMIVDDVHGLRFGAYQQ